MKKFGVLVLLVLISGFVFAGEVSYKEKFSETRYLGSGSYVSRTVWTEYDNEDRHSIYDYRHGYSYRASSEYFDRKVANELDWGRRSSEVIVLRDYDKRDYDIGDLFVRRKFDSGKVAKYYEYVPYMRGYEERECFVSPPRDRLFYVKC